MIGNMGLFKPSGDNAVEKFMYTHYKHHHGRATVQWVDETGAMVFADILACHPEILAFSVVITDVQRKEQDNGV